MSRSLKGRAIPGWALKVALFALGTAGVALCAAGAWKLVSSPPGMDELRESSKAALVLDEGRAVCRDISRVVTPGIQRTRLAAADPSLAGAIKSGDATKITELCNRVMTMSTEIDALAVFDDQGRILAINTVYADGSKIELWRVQKVLGLDFNQRDIIQSCVRNQATRDVLEFQTTCDITPAFFDSTGLSVAFSTPVLDSATGVRLGVVSSRLQFTRLTALIHGRTFGDAGGVAEFVTDSGGYFSEEINSHKRPEPVPTSTLAAAVAPLAAGDADYALHHIGDAYVSLFRLKDFETLKGGGIQLMLLLSDEFLASQFTQVRHEAAAWTIGAGVACLALGAFVRATRRVGESELRNRMLIDTAMDAVVMVTASGMVTSWNPAAETTFGVPRSDAMGKRLQEIVQLGTAAGSEPLSFAALAATTATLGCCEVRARRRDGGELVMDAAVVAMDPSSEWSYSVFLRDVTQRKELELRLAQSQKLESIGQLAAGIAHEINTPVQYVSDNVRFLKDQFGALMQVTSQTKAICEGNGATQGADREALCAHVLGMDFEFLNAEVPLALDQSLEGLERVATIVRAMKEFSHPGTAKMGPADLNQAIRSTATVCTNRWKYVAELHMDLDPGLPPVPCLVAEFNQVILNLIVNAADAIGEHSRQRSAKGNITVRTRALEHDVEIRVEDDGPGIPDAVQQRLFEPFFTTKVVGKGTGQGLAISRSVIVKKHGGTLRFESTVGKGTAFIITLPMCAMVKLPEESSQKEAA